MKRTFVGLGIILSGGIAALFTMGIIFACIGGNLTDGVTSHPDSRDFCIDIVSLAVLTVLLRYRIHVRATQIQ